MEDKLIEFETAKLAKEKGFNFLTKKCYLNSPDRLIFRKSVGFYTDEIDPVDWDLIHAPTQSLLQKWLREVQGIVITINHWTEQRVNGEVWDNCYDYNFYQLENHGTTPHRTYEEALEKGLQEALKLIENEK